MKTGVEGPPIVPKTQDWSQVQVGDILQGKDRRPWTIMDIGPGHVEMEREDGKEWSGAVPTGPVTVLSSAAEEAAFAVAVAQVHLGGEVVAETDEHGRHVTPVTFVHAGSLLGHIFIFHGKNVADMDSEEQNLKALLATHAELHKPENRTESSGWVDHVHDPDFYSRRKS